MNSTEPDDKLAELLLRWEEAWDHGEDVPAEQLCAECPDLVEPLRHQIDILKKMAWMKGDSDDSDSGTSPAAPDPLLSKTLGGRYRIDAFLAEGGFGRVYRGFDPELDRPVAVKVAKATAAASPDLLQEARRVAKLRHPGIVPIHDVGHDEGVWFFVSDLLEGQTLADLNQRPTPAEAANLVAQVADALHYAHEQGFVHRDIKPSNILLDAQGRPQITDFGIAVTAEEIADRRNPRSGTLPYMAPEQVAGEVQLIGPRTDVYALGVVLYELLTGRGPYQGRTPTALKEQILFRSPVAPRKIDAKIQPDLEAICLRCLAKHPADRFGSAAELAEALRNRPKFRVRWRLIAAAVLVVVVIATVIWGGRFLPSVAKGPDAELNRRVIEKVLGIGGELEILDRSGRTRLIALADVPNHPFFITEVKVVAKHPFTDDDAELLVGLPRLESVYVAYTDITDRALTALARRPTIEGIGCGANNITDAGLEPLTGLKRLGFLDLNTTKQITDRAFDHLDRMENLRQLNVAGTSVSPEAVEAFKRRRPECRVQP
jgi:serine/threonine protein kinase